MADQSKFPFQYILKGSVSIYADWSFELQDWLGVAIPEEQFVLNFLESIRRRILTSNMIERVSHETKRRAWVIRTFLIHRLVFG